jgi:hypothetical protein
MKTSNIIIASIVAVILATALYTQMKPKYEIHKTRSGDFIIIDDAKGSRIYEVVELQTDRVTEAFK